MRFLESLVSFFIVILLFQAILTNEIFALIDDTNNTKNIENIDNKLNSASGGVILGNTTGNMNTGNQLESASGGLIGSSSTTFNFKNMVTEGKIIFLNVLNIKPNMPIQYNSLACFSSLNTPEYGKGIEMREIPCDNLIVFGVNEESLANTILSNGPVLSSLLLNALDEGFGKRISACAIFTIDSESEQSRLQNIDCHSLFIAYK